MTRSPLHTWTIRGGVGALLVGGLAVSGWGISVAASSAVGTGPRSSAPLSLASSKSNDSPTSTKPAHPAAGGPVWSGLGAPGTGYVGAGGSGPGELGPGGFGPGGMSIGGITGTISSIGAGVLTLTTPSGTTQKVDTNGSTSYSEDGDIVKRSALQTGQTVAVGFGFPGVPMPMGSSTAKTGASSLPSSAPASSAARVVDIVGPSISGTVVSDSRGTVVVTDDMGFQRTILTASAATYGELGTSVPASAVKTGTEIVAFGLVDADHTSLDASSLRIVGPETGGQVTAVSGATITVSSPAGTTKITTTSATIFKADGTASSLSGVKKGDFVQAIGSSQPDGSFQATGISVESLTVGGGFGPGHRFSGPRPGGSWEPPAPGGATSGSVSSGVATF